MCIRKEKIIEVAKKMFARYGIHKTTMDEIAKKAMIGKSTIYYYFLNKEDILSEILRRDSVIYKLELNQAIARGIKPQEKITNYVKARLKHLQLLNNYYSVLTEEYLKHYVLVENVRKDLIDFEIITLSILLKEGVEMGEFSINSIEKTARNFALCLKGLEFPFFTKDNKSDIEKESMQMLNILFKGIEVRENFLSNSRP